MALPDKLPEWDTTQVNSIEIDQQHKDEGWIAPAGIPEKPPFQSFNYWQNLVYQWIKYFKETGSASTPTIASMLSLTPIDGETVIVQEDLVGGLFHYVDLRSGENDGGMVLDGWVRSRISKVNPSLFGADNTGVTDATLSIKKMFDYCTATGESWEFIKGEYLLSGGDTFDVTTSGNFNGAVLNIDGFSGTFNINRGVASVTYTPGDPEFDLFITATNTQKGSFNIDSIVGSTAFDSALILISTDEALYQYQSTRENKIELNVIYNRGYLASSLQSDLDMASITSIEVFKHNESPIIIGGASIKETDIINVPSIFKIEAANVTLKDVTFITKLIAPVGYVRIYINNSYNVIVDNVASTSVSNTGTNEFTYTLEYANSYNILFKNITAGGDGWGATGSNSCRRVEFQRCILNRIDTHRLFLESLKIKDCVINDNGMILIGFGDVFVENTTFLINDETGFLTARNDGGGIIDGNIYIKNCKIEGINDTLNNYRLFEARWNGVDGLPALPNASSTDYTNSVLTSRLFKNIYIDGLDIPSTVGIVNFYHTANVLTIKGPELIQVKNLEAFVIDMEVRRFINPKVGNGLTTVSGNPTQEISFSDSRFDGIDFGPRATDYDLLVNLNNVKGNINEGVYMQTGLKGLYKISDCSLSAFSAYHTDYTFYAQDIFIENCKVIPSGVYSHPTVSTRGIDVDATSLKAHLVKLSNSVYTTKSDEHQLQVINFSVSRLSLELLEDRFLSVILNSADGVQDLPSNLFPSSLMVVTTGLDGEGTIVNSIFKYMGDGTYNIDTDTGVQQIVITGTTFTYTGLQFRFIKLLPYLS